MVKHCHSYIYSLLILIRKDLCLKMDKSLYQSARQYGRTWEKLLNHLGLKLKFIPKKKLGNGKLWLYQLEKKPYFLYGKRTQIGNVSKSLLILILTHVIVLSAVTAASMLLTLMVLRMLFQRLLTETWNPCTWHYLLLLLLLFLLFPKRIRFGRIHKTWQIAHRFLFIFSL